MWQSLYLTIGYCFFNRYYLAVSLSGENNNRLVEPPECFSGTIRILPDSPDDLVCRGYRPVPDVVFLRVIAADDGFFLDAGWSNWLLAWKVINYLLGIAVIVSGIISLCKKKER
jgi:hypothetical protein